VSHSSSGKKLTELKAWLHGQQPSEQGKAKPASVARLGKAEKGRAVIRGVLIVMAPEEVLTVARQSLADGQGRPANYRNWYV